MRALNNRYRGKDRVTDVLSFSFREGAHSSVQTSHLGDIVIAVPEAVRQAHRAGHSVEREIELLLVHGLLHLAGYDHEKGPSEMNRMRKKERTLHQLLAARRR
jgi:rRNA maturation RNase YbeY